MKIKYYGGSSFELSTKEAKLLTNPFGKKSKAKLNKIKPDIVVVSHKMEVEEDGFFLITTAGEYEVSDVFVYGYSSKTGGEKDEGIANIYVFDLEGIHFGFIDKEVKKVKRSHLNDIGLVNVLFMSLASDVEMTMSKKLKLIRKVEPQMVIVMDYDKENLAEFTKSLGIKAVDKEKTLKLSKNEFKDDDMPLRCVILDK